MGKNDKVFKIFLYLAIIICFIILLINFCKGNLVEGFEDKKKTSNKDMTDEEKAAKEAKLRAEIEGIKNKFQVKQNQELLKTDQPYVTFQRQLNGRAIGDPGMPNWVPLTQGVDIWSKAGPAAVVMAKKALNLDPSGNSNPSATAMKRTLNSQIELLRLKGLEAVNTRWNTTDPEFIQFYKDKMFFLNDLMKYMNYTCKNYKDNCVDKENTDPSIFDKLGSDNWFGGDVNNSNDNNGADNMANSNFNNWLGGQGDNENNGGNGSSWFDSANSQIDNLFNGNNE